MDKDDTGNSQDDLLLMGRVQSLKALVQSLKGTGDLWSGPVPGLSAGDRGLSAGYGGLQPELVVELQVLWRKVFSFSFSFSFSQVGRAGHSFEKTQFN